SCAGPGDTGRSELDRRGPGGRGRVLRPRCGRTPTTPEPCRPCLRSVLAPTRSGPGEGRRSCGPTTGRAGARPEVGWTGDVRRGRAGTAGPGPYRCAWCSNVGGSGRCVRDVGPTGATPSPGRGQGGPGGRSRGRTGDLPPTAVVWPRSTKQWGRKGFGDSRRGCRPPP